MEGQFFSEDRLIAGNVNNSYLTLLSIVQYADQSASVFNTSLIIPCAGPRDVVFAGFADQRPYREINRTAGVFTRMKIKRFSVVAE